MATQKRLSCHIDCYVIRKKNMQVYAFKTMFGCNCAAAGRSLSLFADKYVAIAQYMQHL